VKHGMRRFAGLLCLGDGPAAARGRTRVARHPELRRRRVDIHGHARRHHSTPEQKEAPPIRMTPPVRARMPAAQWLGETVGVFERILSDTPPR
jgi:hypothetical protein